MFSPFWNYNKNKKNQDLEELNHQDLAILEIEASDFEHNFDEIDGGWRTTPALDYLSQKGIDNEFYGGMLFYGYVLGSIAAYQAYFEYTGAESLTIPVIAPMLWMSGLMGSFATGAWMGKKINNISESVDDSFEGEYRKIDFEDAKKVLEESDEVKYIETRGIPWSTNDPIPYSAVRDYSDLVELFEEERSYWQDQLDVNSFEKLTDEEKEIIEAYAPEDDTTDIVDIKGLEKLQRHHEEEIEHIQEMLDGTVLSQYLRWKEVDNEAYEGQIYQLELYKEVV